MAHHAWLTLLGSQRLAHSAWLTLHGTQSLARSAWLTVHGSQCVAPSVWLTMHGSRCMTHSAWSCVPLGVDFFYMQRCCPSATSSPRTISRTKSSNHIWRFVCMFVCTYVRSLISHGSTVNLNPAGVCVTCKKQFSACSHVSAHVRSVLGSMRGRYAFLHAYGHAATHPRHAIMSFR